MVTGVSFSRDDRSGIVVKRFVMVRDKSKTFFMSTNMHVTHASTSNSNPSLTGSFSQSPFVQAREMIKSQPLELVAFASKIGAQSIFDLSIKKKQKKNSSSKWKQHQLQTVIERDGFLASSQIARISSAVFPDSEYPVAIPNTAGRKPRHRRPNFVGRFP